MQSIWDNMYVNFWNNLGNPWRLGSIVGNIIWNMLMIRVNMKNTLGARTKNGNSSNAHPFKYQYHTYD
jgi:hypothetical protein